MNGWMWSLAARLAHKALPVKFKAAERVNDLAALQQVLRLGFGRAVGIQMLGRRLVGDVVVHMLFVVAHALQRGAQRRQERLQKRAVFRACRRHVPAEDAPLLPIHHGHDLGRGVRAPLGEQMGDLQIFHAVAPAQPAQRPSFSKPKEYTPASRRTSTSCTVSRSPFTAVSSGGVNTGVSSILMPCSSPAARMKFSRMRQCSSLSGATP